MADSSAAPRSAAGPRAAVAAAPAARSAGAPAGGAAGAAAGAAARAAMLPADGRGPLDLLAGVFVRRRRPMLLLLLAGIAATLAAAYFLPATWRSTAVLAVQDQDLPADADPAKSAALAADRVRALAGQVLRTEALAGIAAQGAARSGAAPALDELRASLQVTARSVQNAPAAGPGQPAATIRFEVSAEAGSPQAAQQRVTALAGLFLAENARARPVRQGESAAALAEAAGLLGARVAESEAKLSAFAARHPARGAEAGGADLAALDRALAELARLDQRLALAESRPASAAGDGADRGIAALRAARAEVQNQVRTLQARARQGLQADREFIELGRVRDDLVARYRDLRARQASAEAAESLERARGSQRYALVEAAAPGIRAGGPGVAPILAGGIAASLLAAFVLGTLLELADRSVKGAQDLARLLPVPLLGTIPYVPERIAPRRRGGAVAAAVLVIAAAAALISVHLWVRPLPALARAVLRGLGLV